MRSTLAIYITLFAVAVVAIAQILYWKLVVTRDQAVTEEIRDAERLPEALVMWTEIEMEADETDLATEPVLLAA